MKVVTITNIINESGKTTLAGLYASYLKEVKGREVMLLLAGDKGKPMSLTEKTDYRIISIEREKINTILKKLVNTSIDVIVIDYTPDTEIASIQSTLTYSDRIIIPFTNSPMDIAATKILLNSLENFEIYSKIRLLPVKIRRKYDIENIVKKNFSDVVNIKDIILPYINNLSKGNYLNMLPNILVRTRPTFTKFLSI